MLFCLQKIKNALYLQPLSELTTSLFKEQKSQKRS
jgi:hypothetical protein